MLVCQSRRQTDVSQTADHIDRNNQGKSMVAMVAHFECGQFNNVNIYDVLRHLRDDGNTLWYGNKLCQRDDTWRYYNYAIIR